MGVSVTTVPVTGTLTTPASVALERKNSYTLTFMAEGYESSEFQIQHQMRTGILVADILLTGLIGVVVDAVTGGWYKLEPKTVSPLASRAPRLRHWTTLKCSSRFKILRPAGPWHLNLRRVPLVSS